VTRNGRRFIAPHLPSAPESDADCAAGPPPGVQLAGPDSSSGDLGQVVEVQIARAEDESVLEDQGSNP
jgi:hypothetical protein